MGTLWQCVVILGTFAAGFSAASCVSGSRGSATAARVLCAVLLGAGVVWLSVPAVIVGAISGDWLRAAMAVPKAWALLAGVAAAIATAISAHGAVVWKRAAVVGAAVAIAAGGWLIVRGAGAAGSSGEPVAVVVPVAGSSGEPVVTASSAVGGCACGSALLCTGPRGGRYCIAADGRKRYQ